ncbi:hypothetical protein GCM10023221_06630 [Luteimicrobium xylanilyticum]|uniref:Uncharacterized protein n=1 Tax=Luteimicrobium xylanilyticum TaxID=1133546 RepID=A0A5P9QA75_9MICO|nr:hypothetical protein [Luteimicrobium xylanilyticum]QFU98351.1 hypothetical protein KDY119_01863 [Luteimicrobium xylanilyticum]
MSAGQALAVAGISVGLLAVSVLGGLVVVPAVLRAAGRTSASEASGSADAAPSPEAPDAAAVLRGGTWIGILERLAVTGCLLAGFPAGVAVVVAVKGLGRYPEIRDNPGVSERFVIGTLASLAWAGAAGLLGLWLNGLVR